MKRILAVGDSFTYGAELKELTSAWPSLLGKKLGYAVDNYGLQGGGNQQMVRTVVQHSDQHEIIIIAWSHYARMEFADGCGVFDVWPGSRGLEFAGETAHRKDLLKYINLHHNDHYLYKQYLLNIILLQNYLKSKNKKYIMLDTFGNLELRKQFYNFSNLVDSTFYLGWPNETMMEWTYGCPQGPGGHFLEEGHAVVAEKINEHIRNLGWIS